MCSFRECHPPRWGLRRSGRSRSLPQYVKGWVSSRSNEPSGRVVEGAAEEEADWQSPTGFRLKFGDKVGRADVKRHSGGEGETVLAEYWDLLRQQRAEETRDGEGGTGSERRAPALPRCQEEARDRQPLGQLVQQDRKEHQHAEGVADTEAAGDGNAIHERVQNQTGQR